jgi:hypothetical protein
MPNTVPAADTGLPNFNHESKNQNRSMSETAPPARQWPDYIDAELAIDRTQSLMLAARSLETTFGGEREAMEELFTMALDQITTVKTWFHAFMPEVKREGL